LVIKLRIILGVKIFRRFDGGWVGEMLDRLDAGRGFAGEDLGEVGEEIAHQCVARPSTIAPALPYSLCLLPWT
jgi:hypothetical protein